jgi:hypothetical protein
MAETMRDEAATLKKIGNGDTTELKGESADVVRKNSLDVGGSLEQASGRYEAVGKALEAYKPELEEARDQSAKALVEADEAEAARVSSNALADPSANRADDAPPLTDQDTADILRRTTAIGNATDSSSAAKTRLDNALAALDDAGQRASTAIKAAWNDGLTDTTAYKIKQFFVKFLKILVKVLMWIGVALAVLAFFIPGLGALALAGAIVAVSSLLASTALAIMGEGSWLDVILAAVGVLLLGSGALIAKIVQNSHIGLLGKVGAKSAINASKFSAKIDLKRAALFKAGLNGKIPLQNAMARLTKMDAHLISSNTKVAAKLKGFEVKPQFWNIKHPDYLKNDFGKIKDVMKGDWRWDRLLSVDRALKYKELQGVAGNLGIASKSQPFWHFENGGRVIAGWGLLVNKVGSFPPSAYHDSVNQTKGDLTTAKL